MIGLSTLLILTYYTIRISRDKKERINRKQTQEDTQQLKEEIHEIHQIVKNSQEQ
jgi:hypothetical protein